MQKRFLKPLINDPSEIYVRFMLQKKKLFPLLEPVRSGAITPLDVLVLVCFAQMACNRTMRIFSDAWEVADLLGQPEAVIEESIARLQAHRLLALAADSVTGAAFYLIDPSLIRSGGSQQIAEAYELFEAATQTRRSA